ncbi:unnamed protein product [Hymenolepis diminuta]|uniref:Polyprenal reductase n=1 Tax=Hymenolepis diminuta TaxID=6216 RepID=A0A0R3SX97_HYMDI|nr:unnamed protein product [Hymenolepis diminuta]
MLSATIWSTIFSLQNVVIIIYLSASLFSYFALLISKYPRFSKSFPLLNSVFLFGKSAMNSPTYSFLLVPKRWFCHFYFTSFIYGFNKQSAKRLYENLFVQIFSESVMSVTHYFVGHYFYLTMPLSIYWSENKGYFMMGFYFICSMIVIMLQHIVVLQLADTRRNVPKGKLLFIRNTYRLPTGYMFAHVTCPHFALEISLYAIIHLILGLRRLPFTATFIFILSNQLCSGMLNHMWYQRNYPEFARSRNIIIPFVF